MNFPNYINLIFDTFERHNYEAYIVGGFVRDYLLGKSTSDFDFTTNAKPEDIKKIFSTYRQLYHGEKYGSISIMVDGNIIEITSYRKEIEYKDNRHPEIIFANTLEEDLKRRDFTINALCMNKKGEITDLFEGQKDLKNKTIRAIGNAEKRFEEDALRILRAVRFSATLGFEIEANTYLAMQKTMKYLDNISKERKYEEFTKALMGEYIKQSLCDYNEIYADLCKEYKIMKGFLQNNPYHLYDVLEHSAIVVEKTPFDLQTRLASFFHDTGKVYTYSFKNGVGHFYGHGRESMKICERDLKKLGMSEKRLNELLILIRYHDCTVYPEKSDVKKWLKRLGKNQLIRLFDLQTADNLAKSAKAFYKVEMIESARRIMDEIIENKEAYLAKHLKIDGKDLQSLGLKGKEIGHMLDILLQHHIEEKVQNEKEELLNLAKEKSKECFTQPAD